MYELRAPKPLIIPVFLPFQGCPHRCVYCEQEKIASCGAEPIHPSSVTRLIEQSLRSPRFALSEKPEAAFYGGTFTRLPKARMQELFEAVSPFLRNGTVDSIRLSTRPDALEGETLGFLKDWGVKTVELGAQSLDDEVLRLSKRGHSAQDTIRSFRLLRKHGFKIGLQLMPGLPGDSREKFLATVDQVVDLGPDMVRLYPTVVIQGTELAYRYCNGRYEPLSLDQALEVCAESVLRLERSAIAVIRIGLMSSASLRAAGQVVAGPWHEAFGHMVRSMVYHRRIEWFLPPRGQAKRIRLKVHPREVPLMRGFKNKGIRDVEMKTGATVEGVAPDETLAPGCIRVETP